MFKNKSEQSMECSEAYIDILDDKMIWRGRRWLWGGGGGGGGGWRRRGSPYLRLMTISLLSVDRSFNKLLISAPRTLNLVVPNILIQHDLKCWRYQRKKPDDELISTVSSKIKML